MSKFKVGDEVVKVLSLAGFRTGSIGIIVGIHRHGDKDFIGVADDCTDDDEALYDGVYAYHKETGKAYESVMSDMSLLTLDEAKDQNIEMEQE